MKAPSLKSLLLVGLTGLGAIAAQAQPAPKIAVVDLAKLFDNYWKTSSEITKINGEKSQAQTSAEAIAKNRADLVQKAQQLYNETSNNPVIAADAKAKADAQLKDLSNEINSKTQDLQNFTNNTQEVLRNEFNTFKTLALSDINEVATRIAKSHGANLLIDRSNSTMYQTSAFLYIAPDYSDLTDEVLAELNRGHATTPPAAADKAAASGMTAPSTATPSTSDKPPSVTFGVPGSK